MTDIALRESPPRLIELALRSERMTTVILLVTIPLACWTWIVVMARDMYGPMTGASRWMMTPAWDAPHLLLLWAMWAVMMIAMMLPSAAPLILLYGAAARRRAAGSPQASVYALALGYVTLWALFSVAATAAQRVLGETLVMSPMMELTLPAASSALLVFAGLYQLTRIKSICLGVCQSPLGFLMAHWRDGAAGAFRLGLRHGLYCLGCCWALMLLLFVGGVMNLTAIVGLTVFIALEKSRWLGRWGSRASGGLLIALGLLTLADVL